MLFSKISFGYLNQIESWREFILQLGRYFENYATENKNTFNFYIKIPEVITFSQFLLLGIFDAQMSQTMDRKKIVNNLKKLKYGDSIYFYENEKWKLCSVIEVVENYMPPSPWHIMIKNHKKVTQYIPYERWEKQVIIANRKTDTILNARVKKNMEESTYALEKIYSKDAIRSYEMLNTVAAHIVGNKTEFKRRLKEMFLTYESSIITFEKILRDCSEDGFRNVNWLNDKEDSIVSKKEWLLLIGASYATKKYDNFEKHGKIILDNQFGNPLDSEFLRNRIEQDIILNNRTIITNEIVKDLAKVNINLPKGVVMIAWR